MRSVFLKIISSFALTILILSMQPNPDANAGAEFPYHIDGAATKEMTYNYSFETVWETALTVLGEMEKDKLRSMHEAGFHDVKTAIREDKGSGLIRFMLTHKGKKKYFSTEKSSFFYQYLSLEPYEQGRTRACFHENTFLSYDNYVFHGQQAARYLDLAPPAKDILEEILAKLRESSVENP